MAIRRMMSLKVVDTDAFLDMPQSSQLLYFHLAMRADDDGFVPNPRKIMRVIGSGEDDYKVLVAKKFIIPFESGVCVIKHWLIHNLIRSDRYTETQYVREKAMLVVDPVTKKYSLNKGENPVIPVGNQLATQGRVELGKGSKEKGVSSMEYLKNIPEADMVEFIGRFEISTSQVKSVAEDLILYCQRKGKSYKDYKAFLLNAIKKDTDRFGGLKYPQRKVVARPTPTLPMPTEKALTAEQRAGIEKTKKEISDKFKIKTV